MGTEMVKSETQSSLLTIGAGPISLEGLTPTQQNELRMLAAKKGVDLAADAAKKQLQLQAASAEVDVVLCAAKRLNDIGARACITSTSKTATGAISIRAKKGLIF